jgi:hypothetical protein
LNLLLPGRVRRSPHHALSFSLRVVLKVQTLVVHHDSLQNVSVVLHKFNETATTVDTILFLLRSQAERHKTRTNLWFP